MSDIKAIVLSTSPRKDGNSDMLSKESFRAIRDSGIIVEHIRTPELKISPCRSCGYCEETGVCALKDDFPPLMQKMLEADLLVFATPIYFMAVGAWGKMVIDRCQTLWARKYVLKTSNRPENKKTWAAFCIAVGGSRSVKMFDSISLTMKYFYDVLDISVTDELFLNQLDQKGAVKDRPEIMAEAYQKTKTLIDKLEAARKS